MSADVISSRAMQWASKVQSIADQARDLTLEAAQSVGARYADESKAVDINKLLEGRSDREKIDGMRRTIAISSRGTDMSEHFASVVKNVASPNLELRKLVYIYISRYAESQPDLALLSINTIQKALSDQNQIVRALALRVMSSIRVPSISGIILLAIKKCMSDSSFYVRKTAAMAITKTIQLDPSLAPQLLDCLKILLSDSHPAVLSAAIETYEAVCPARVDLIHQNYRRICHLLGQMDEFSQVNVLRVLTIYCRRCFISPHPDNTEEPEKDFYEQDTADRTTNADLARFTKSLLTMLQSRSSAVVLAVVRALYALAPSIELYQVAEPLIALLRQPQDIQFVSLTNIATIALNNPALWHKYAKHFFVYPTEPEHIWQLKLEIMTLIVCEENSSLILPELAQYSADTTNDKLSRSATHAIGKCAQHVPSIASSAIDILFAHLRSDESILITESVVAIRHLVQLNPAAHVGHIRTLIKSLPKVTAPVARATIFWIVSENLGLLQRYAPDVLRLGARSFPEEDEQVRLQILTLAVKLYVLHSQRTNEQDVEDMNAAMKKVDEARQAVEHESETQDKDTQNTEVKLDIETEALPEATQKIPETDSIVPQLYAYISQLTRYDVSYDLRDRLRTYKILASSPNWVLTQKVLFSQTPVPTVTSPSTTKSKYAIGSTSMIAGVELSGYADLPPWSTVVIGKAERDVEIAAPIARQGQASSLASSTVPSRSSTPKITAPAATTTVKSGSKLTGISSLDDFYATSSSEVSSSSDDDDEEETDSSEATASEEEEESSKGKQERHDTESSGEEETSSEEDEDEDEDDSDEDEADQLLVESRR